MAMYAGIFYEDSPVSGTRHWTGNDFQVLRRTKTINWSVGVAPVQHQETVRVNRMPNIWWESNDCWTSSRATDRTQLNCDKVVNGVKSNCGIHQETGMIVSVVSHGPKVFYRVINNAFTVQATIGRCSRSQPVLLGGRLFYVPQYDVSKSGGAQ